MYTALYRAFRPETFDAVLGQEHIVRILKNQIRTETTSHAYLFCGTRGTGKTTTARILAKGVNCTAPIAERPCGHCENCLSIKEGTFLDVIEIDAASNNGVDNIRELRESVKYPPAVGRCKVYIVDEVHMLSTGAFNALLKTLEEPPENVMFILATTEPQKLPATILSRCLRLDFKRVPETTLKQGMRDICAQIDVAISDSALGLIAANADGSVRDGLSLLDQCISSGRQSVNREDVLELLGTSGEEVFIEMTDFVRLHHVSEALLLLDKILADGKDVRQFMKDWVAHFRSLLMTKFVKNPADLLNMSCENVERVRSQSEQLDLAVINDSIIELSKVLADAKWSTQPRILLELCIVRMATGSLTTMMGSPNPNHGQQSINAPQTRESTVSPPKQESLLPREEKDQKKAVEREETEESTAESLERPEVPAVDCDQVWHAVFEEGELQKGSFNLLRSGSVLKRITNDTFYVEASNEMVRKFAEENKNVIERLMEKQIGRHLVMECHLYSVQNESREQKMEKVAKAAGDRWGLNIQVE